VERVKWAVEDLVGWRMWGEREKEEEGEEEEEEEEEEEGEEEEEEEEAEEESGWVAAARCGGVEFTGRG
jgi:hypothetical protein